MFYNVLFYNIKKLKQFLKILNIFCSNRKIKKTIHKVSKFWGKSAKHFEKFKKFVKKICEKFQKVDIEHLNVGVILEKILKNEEKFDIDLIIFENTWKY